MPPRKKTSDRGLRVRHLTEGLRALRMLRVGRCDVEALAAELDCTRRTAYRLLVALERAGIHLERQREGKRVYYRVTREDLEVALGLRPEPAMRVRAKSGRARLPGDADPDEPTRT